MQEFIAKEWEDRFDSFAKAEPVGGENFLCAGLFYNRYEPYLQNIANLIRKIIDKGQLYNDFKLTLEHKNHKVQGEALYKRYVVNRWRKPFRILKSGKEMISFYRYKKDEKLFIEDLKLGNPSNFDKRSGVIFLRIKGYEDKEISKEVEWNMRKDLLYVWIELCSSQEVKQYLQNIKEIINLLEEFYRNSWEVYAFRRLFFYLLPVYFDRFGNSVIVSRASLFNRKDETRSNLWQSIMESLEKEGLYEDFVEFMNGNRKSLEDIKGLLEQALSQDTLKALRQDWKIFLKKVLMGESTKLVGQIIIKDSNPTTWVSFGKYLVPKKDIDLYIFYEPQISEEDLKLLESELKTFQYAENISVRIIGKYPLERLFGGQDFFSLLKGLDQKTNTLRHLESTKLLYALTYFCARLANLQRQIEADRESFKGVLIVLNTDLEDGQMYEFWNAVSFIYDYYGLPVQTITKRFINKLRSKDKAKETAKKNMLISLYKDAKVLQFDFDGFSLPEGVVIYAVLEKPSSTFFYTKGEKTSGIRHGLYEVYKIQVEEKSATVGVENKFILMGGGLNDESQELERFIREGLEERKEVRFCFISPLENSYLKALYDRLASHAEYQGKLLSLRYKELKTAYISRKEEESCLIIYTQEFRKLVEKLGIFVEKDAAVIGIKPSRPMQEEEFYHPAFQLFFTEKIGWDREDVYSERKNLFLFTLIALSMFESEAAQIAYSKLNLWSKERNIYLAINRKDEIQTNRTYTFVLSPVLYELLEFLKHIPGDDKIQ